MNFGIDADQIEEDGTVVLFKGKCITCNKRLFYSKGLDLPIKHRYSEIGPKNSDLLKRQHPICVRCKYFPLLLKRGVENAIYREQSLRVVPIFNLVPVPQAVPDPVPTWNLGYWLKSERYRMKLILPKSYIDYLDSDLD